MRLLATLSLALWLTEQSDPWRRVIVEVYLEL